MRIMTILLAAVLFWWWFYPAPTRTLPEQFTPEEKAYYAERHRYHGIGGSVTERGQRYFYREGRRCRL